MSVFTFIIMIIVLTAIVGPLAKGLGNRLEKGGPAGADLKRLAEELERAEQRIADAERRLAQAEDRLDFQERLLSPRSSTPDT